MSTTTTPPSPAEAHIQQLIGTLAQANIAIPIIVTTVTSVLALVRALTGSAPPLKPLIERIEAQAAENRTRGDAEIARLKALLDDEHAPNG